MRSNTVVKGLLGGLALLGAGTAAGMSWDVVSRSGDLFVRHTVQEGDTLFAVARTYGTSVTSLATVNALDDISRLGLGQILLVPLPAASKDAGVSTGTVLAAGVPRVTSHVVAPGETLFAVARQYHLSVDLLVQINALRDPKHLTPGQTLRLAPAVGSPPPPPPQGPFRSKDAPPAPLAWPLRGPLLRRFGQDGSPSLLVGAPEGTPVCAAADGKVLAAGWMKGFGNAVYIQHRNGLATFYGNCGIFFCRQGTEVRTGERIAAVGKTPDTAPSHLAFTVLRQGRAVDPLTLLSH